MTLIEVMLALAAIAITLTPIFITQGGMIKRVNNEARAIQRFFYAQQYSYESDIELQQKKVIPPQKEILKPSMRIAYKETPPAKESALSKYPNIILRTIKWHWQQDGEQISDALVSLVYQPAQKEQEA